MIIFLMMLTHLSWIGLANWIPFFWCYWGLNHYLILRRREKIIHNSSSGTLPVLVSGFGQVFLIGTVQWKFLMG